LLASRGFPDDYFSAQASEIKNIGDWGDPLAAIVLYTFDLNMLSPKAAHAAEENFYFRLNNVGFMRFVRHESEPRLLLKQKTLHLASCTLTKNVRYNNTGTSETRHS
jgi:hypothetical protein